MIPDEAVEAAAEAMHDRDAYAELFEDAPEHRRARYLDAARGILEAAAPHLMAPVLALADQWQEDFPYKADQLREAIGATK